MSLERGDREKREREDVCCLVRGTCLLGREDLV